MHHYDFIHVTNHPISSQPPVDSNRTPTRVKPDLIVVLHLWPKSGDIHKAEPEKEIGSDLIQTIEELRLNPGSLPRLEPDLAHSKKEGATYRISLLWCHVTRHVCRTLPKWTLPPAPD